MSEKIFVLEQTQKLNRVTVVTDSCCTRNYNSEFIKQTTELFSLFCSLLLTTRHKSTDFPQNYSNLKSTVNEIASLLVRRTVKVSKNLNFRTFILTVDRSGGCEG